MKPRAYSLREWFAFLYGSGVHWTDANDLIMHRWKQKLRDENLSPAQIELKLRRVFDFYLNIPEALVRFDDGSPVSEFVGKNSARSTVRFPISTKRIQEVKSKEFRIVWIAWDAVTEAAPKLTVLENSDRDLVLSELRSPSNVSTNLDDYAVNPLIKRERDWAMGRLMSGGGLRAAEVPELSLIDFTEALIEEGVLRGLGRERVKSLRTVADLADDEEAKKIALSGLKNFERRRLRLYIGVRIVGKGQKERKAGFLVDLVYDLLTVVIWGGRHQLIKHWQSLDPTYVPEDSLFLSYKRKDRLKPGAVSDIMKQAFIRANVPGSGHDLRKSYATNLAASILRRNLDRFGYFTHAVLNTVMSEVAEALGHKTINTTTQHYTNLAVVHSTGIEDSRKRGKVMKVWELLLQSKDMMDDERIRLCGTAVKVFSELPKESELFGVLQYAMTNPDYNPSGLIDLSTTNVPHLRLVSDNHNRPVTE